METGPNLEPGPQGSRIWGKKKVSEPELQNQKNQTQTRIQRTPIFFLKSKPEPELLY